MQNFGKFIACDTQNIDLILHEMRFNPCEVRLTTGKLEKLEKNWNFEMLLNFQVLPNFPSFPMFSLIAPCHFT